MPDTELAKSLQDAKKKPRNFAIIAKGANVVHLVVQKKPIQAGALQKMKLEYGGNAIVKGVINGVVDSEMIFQVSEASPVGEVKLRTYITDKAEVHIKPKFQVVEGLKELDEELEAGGSQPISTSESSSFSSDPSVVETDEPSALFQFRLKDLKPKLKRVRGAKTSVAKEVETLTGEMAGSAKKAQFGDALLKLEQLETLVQRGLEELSAQAQRAKAKVTPGGGAGLSEKDAQELNVLMEDALIKCPALADHLAKTMGGEGSASVHFSDVAKDAFYTSKGDKSRGIPDHVIILPKSGKTPLDLLDGLIFETCNAEIQIEYDQLTKEFVQALNGTPLDVADFGLRKATIEAKTVLKHTQLLFQARKSEVEVAYQGNRNLLAMLRTCCEQNGDELPDYEDILEDPARLKKCLEENEEKLGAFLESADKEPKVREAVLKAMAESPHNRNAKGPTEKGGLKTCDLYAYELLETAPSQVVQMLEHEIGKVVDLGGLPMDRLRPWMADRIARYDGDDKSARQAMILRTIDDLKKMFPELADAEFAGLGFSPEMKKMAEARMTDFKTKNASKFIKMKREALQAAIEKVNGVLMTGLEFLNSFADTVKKDTRPVLETLEGLRSIAGIPAVITRITEKQTGETPVLQAKDAELIGQSLQEAVVNSIGAYNESAMEIDVEEGKPADLKRQAIGMANAAKGFPPAWAKPMQTPLKLFLIAVDDLESL